MSVFFDLLHEGINDLMNRELTTEGTFFPCASIFPFRDGEIFINGFEIFHQTEVE